MHASSKAQARAAARRILIWGLAAVCGLVGAAFEGRLAQAVDQALLVQTSQPLLAQRWPSAVPNQALQTIAVPVRNRDRGIDRPAASMVAGVSPAGRRFQQSCPTNSAVQSFYLPPRGSNGRHVRSIFPPARYPESSSTLLPGSIYLAFAIPALFTRVNCRPWSPW